METKGIIICTDRSKYKLSDKQELAGRVLYSIIALRDFGDVHAGDVGGLVESYENLSQSGNCWIYPGSVVYDGSVVSNDAKVVGHSCIQDSYISGSSIVMGSVVRHSFIKDSSYIKNCFVRFCKTGGYVSLLDCSKLSESYFCGYVLLERSVVDYSYIYNNSWSEINLRYVGCEPSIYNSSIREEMHDIIELKERKGFILKEDFTKELNDGIRAAIWRIFGGEEFFYC